ncbi:MAG TPA: EF-hand domain-containing protein [Stellaceae bacterium]|nr:EF-hand domain-containing protein [Stellaceae bacterium]
MSPLLRTLPLIIAVLAPISAYAQANAPQPAPRRDWADRYLARIDTERKGFITLQDAERFAAAQFDRLDANRDGVVDHDEFVASAKRSLERVSDARKPQVQRSLDRRETLFKTLDQHGDGKLTKDEYLAGTRQHFAEIDTKKSGLITADDLRTAHRGL